MKRYKINSTVEVTENPFRDFPKKTVISRMDEDPKGEWVQWSEVEKMRAELEAQIPEKRIERLEKMMGLVHEGKCPECERPVRDYKSPSGGFAPEAWATLREMGVDPATGHRFGCSKAKP